jgi:sugar O-acyltransferase (sialic acid O-acetyltransferase NeuD family)
MNINKGLVILGFGGHARSVADVALSVGFNSLLFVDKNAKDGETFLGFTVRKEIYGAIPQGWECMPATGDNRLRQEQVLFVQSAGWPLATLVSGTATIGAGAEISPGCFVGRHAHIGPMAKVGAGCIINTGAVVEHECIVEDYTHVSVNSTLAGRSHLGKFVFLGTGATVIDGISIVDNVTIGAGGVVVESIGSPGTYVGVPAKKIASPV